MSLLNLKQLRGPAASGHGASIVFDGTKPVWSETATGGLLLPSGSTTQRPGSGVVKNGHLRYNNQTDKFEVYENGAWTDVVTGPKSFSTLVDGPGSMADKAGQYVRVNENGTGLAYFNAPLANVLTYRFRVNFSGTNPNPVGTFDEIPDGWTIELISADDVTITHNLGRAPVGGMFFGNFPSGTNYRDRFIGSSAADLIYNSTNPNVCGINNVTTTNAGALSSSHCFVQLWFTTN